MTTQNLYCETGSHYWQRETVRGVKPSNCPDHGGQGRHGAITTSKPVTEDFGPVSATVEEGAWKVTQRPTRAILETLRAAGSKGPRKVGTGRVRSVEGDSIGSGGSFRRAR
jgi:hypothetical protein